MPFSTMIRTAFLLLAALYAASISGAAAGQLHVEIVSKGFQHDFWRQVNRGCDAAGREFGASIHFTGPELDSGVKEQIDLFREAINKNPDAICLAAISPEPALLELVYQAVGAGIPVITFDSDIGVDVGDDVQAFVATDNLDAGAHAAVMLHQAVSERLSAADAASPLRIGVFSQDLVSQSIGDRTFGFIERMKELCGGGIAVEGSVLYRSPNPGARVILDVGIPPETLPEAMDAVVRGVLTKPNVIGAYGSNEFAAKSMVNVNEELRVFGPDKAVGIGFDSGAAQIRAVRDRVFFGAITQNPYMIGYLSVKTAVDAANGRPVANVAVPYLFYTADNIGREEIAACLYE